MKNLKIKKTIWQTYKTEIKFMLFISLALCIIYVICLNVETIKMILLEISNILDSIKMIFLEVLYILDSLFSRIENWLSIVFKPIGNATENFLVYYFDTIYIYISLGIAIIFIVRYFMFIYRQQYIPLTQEEMEANNITDIYEYFSFISNLLLGHIPRRYLMDIKSSTTILLASQNIKNESQISWIKSKLESHDPSTDNLKYIFRKIFRNNHKFIYILKICLQILFFINLLTPMLIEYGKYIILFVMIVFMIIIFILLSMF